MTRRILLLVVIASSLMLACGKKNKHTIVHNTKTANGNGNPEELAEISFEETQINFGEIIQGQVVERDYKFTNTGKNDLVIYDATATCGCTKPEFPKNPIKPGQSDVIHVKFDSSGKEGHQTKTITLTCNTQPNEITLQLVGDVLIK